MHHISRDIGDRTNAGPFFGRLTIFQHTFVWDSVFVQNQFCRLLRRLLRCDVALVSPMVKIGNRLIFFVDVAVVHALVTITEMNSQSCTSKEVDWAASQCTTVRGTVRSINEESG